MLDTDRIRDEVREHYAGAARAASAGRTDADAQADCCGPSGELVYGGLLYDAADRASLPDACTSSVGAVRPRSPADW